MLKIPAPSAANDFHAEHVRMLLDSYRRLLGQPLLDLADDAEDYGKQVYNASVALLSHNTDANPLFNYANRTAQELFERPWDELIGLSSRYSVEPANIETREQLLAEVSANGYIKNYAGVRIAKSGKRFRINHATVWNVHDKDGVYRGQAATFSDWEILS